LSPEFINDMDTWQLHPALMDQATGFAIDAVAEGIPYLPFSYKKIRINKVLPPNLYTYARLQSAEGGNDEFMTFDLSLIDEQGDSIVEIEGYDLRRIRGEALGAAKPTASVTPASDSGDVTKNEMLKRDKLGDHILTKEGTEVFRRVVAMSATPQIVIASKEFSYLIEQSKPRHKQVAGAEDLDTLLQAPAGHPRPNLAIPYVAPRNELEESIAAIWQSLLGIDKVGVNDSFVELGGHSLMAIQLVARIRETFETELSVAKLYQTPTVAGLTAAIVEALVSQADSEVMEQALAELESPELTPPAKAA
jgi:phthiocerol/phenolphthiocerol synthesis type-I polyketide synthase E